MQYYIKQINRTSQVMDDGKKITKVKVLINVEGSDVWVEEWPNDENKTWDAGDTFERAKIYETKYQDKRTGEERVSYSFNPSETKADLAAKIDAYETFIVSKGFSLEEALGAIATPPPVASPKNDGVPF